MPEGEQKEFVFLTRWNQMLAGTAVGVEYLETGLHWLLYCLHTKVYRGDCAIVAEPEARKQHKLQDKNKIRKSDISIFRDGNIVGLHAF